MTRRTQRNRQLVAEALIAIDESWVACFGDLGMSDLSYNDLLNNMWLRRDQPLHKTDLYNFMPTISQRTAVKYVQHLIDNGLLAESESAHDKRVRQVSLSPILIDRLERYYDEIFRHFLE